MAAHGPFPGPWAACVSNEPLRDMAAPQIPTVRRIVITDPPDRIYALSSRCPTPAAIGTELVEMMRCAVAGQMTFWYNQAK